MGMFLVLVCLIAYDYIRYYYCMALLRVDEVKKGLQLLSDADRLFSVSTIVNYNLFLPI